MHKLIDLQLLMLLLVTKKQIKHCQIMYIEITLYHQNLRTAQNLNYSFLKKKSKVQTCYF